MARRGAPDATGRSSGREAGRRARLLRPPAGEPWAWLSRELVSSPAWRARSVNTIRLVDFLLVESMNHAGRENGNLAATYDQLCVFGLSREEIPAAIREAVYLGLVVVETQGGKHVPSRYRLTFFPVFSAGTGATNEWRRHTDKSLREIRLGARKTDSLVREPVPIRPRLVRKPVPIGASE